MRQEDWFIFQEEICEHFNAIGAEAETNVSLTGVRTSHDVDVFVKTKFLGIDLKWIVEAKHWKRKVNKGHVLALRRAINIEGLIIKSNEFQIRQVSKIIRLEARYYNGEFDVAYEQLKSLITIESLTALSGKYERGRVLERIVYYTATNLYEMEGYVLDRVVHDIKFNIYRYIVLGSTVQVATNVDPLMSLVITDLDYFEAQGYLYGAINLNQLNHCIDDLYENQHMERVQLTYLKSRATYVSFEAIDKLVSVNPYTRGLKKLMYAFSCEHELLSDLEHNELNVKIIQYYQSALPDLPPCRHY